MERCNRLQELEVIINYLSTELEKATQERDDIIFKNRTNVIKSLPAQARNALMWCKIDSDSKLELFLKGDLKVVSTKFAKKEYEKATNPIQRLMAIRGIGITIAEKSIKIIEENGLI